MSGRLPVDGCRHALVAARDGSLSRQSTVCTEYFVRGSGDDLRADPAAFFEAGGNVFARGRDPHFPAWPDVLQLNAFEPALRRAALDTVSAIADQCDGVRCDMAMLVMNEVFRRTWGERAGAPPSADYWRALIPVIQTGWPKFLFLAEAYWDLEWDLQQQGFDYCYDKRFYDRLEHGNAEGVRLHLLADLAYQERLVMRFSVCCATCVPPGLSK